MSPDEPADITRLSAAAGPPFLATAPDVTWARLGAKPKAAASSTPSHPEHWVRIGAGRRRERPPSVAPAPPHFNIHLSNKYDILSVTDFPLLDDGSRASSPLKCRRFPSSNTRRQSQLVFTPAPQWSRARRAGRPSPLRPVAHSQVQRQVQRPTLLLVIGTSLVRHVVVSGGRTFCHPGASINDVKSAALHLSDQYSSVPTLVVEAGVNDIKNQRSEELKQDFIRLVESLLDTGKQVIVSGPLPSPCFSDIKFSPSTPSTAHMAERLLHA